MRKIVILGAGESGTGAAILAQKKGFDVFVSDLGSISAGYKLDLDKYGIAWQEKQHSIDRILEADEIIKSPGIAENGPLIQKAKDKQIPIISEIEFAARYTDAKMICITGSNGKTTTTLLTYHILKNAGLNVGLAGNIGKSLARLVAQCHYDYYVIELSSFQLDGMFDFKADIAVLLNITPDHLDRYNYDMQNYIDAKFRITQNQTTEDAFIFWNDDPVITEELSKRNLKARLFPFANQAKEGIIGYRENAHIVVDMSNGLFQMAEDEISLLGNHNIYNSLASVISAKLVDVRKEEIRKALSSFSGVEHRLEYVTHVKGVSYINDSKATNVNSCWYALSAIHTPIVLILGGTDKGNDYLEIESLTQEKVHTIICLGVDNTPLHAFFDNKGIKMIDTSSMQEAVLIAHREAVSGDTVLLSPCCASFDLFENYEDRGCQFKKYVRDL